MMRGQGKCFIKKSLHTVVASFKTLKECASPSRRLILVDIENYCGKGMVRTDDVRMAKLSITEDLALTNEDLVVVGTSHEMNCLASGVEWRGPRQVLKKGHNGADLALIAAVRDYRIETFAAVIIVSGDGAFLDVAKAARACNRSVVVVTRRGSLSRNLALNASTVRYVPSVA